MAPAAAAESQTLMQQQQPQQQQQQQQQQQKKDSSLNNGSSNSNPNPNTTVAAAKPKPRSSAIWVVKSDLPKLAETTTNPSNPSVNSSATIKGDEKVGAGESKKGGDFEADENPPQKQQQPLVRQVSLSKLNAGAPVFVPCKPSTPTSSTSSSSSVQPGQPGVLTLPVPMPVPVPEPAEADEQQIVSTSAPKSTVLTDELRAQIIQQVEFYFSDANLPTDNYMMKFIKKDPEGFVPVPVIGSFRKVKQLTKNYQALAAALRGSSKLVVSEDGKRIRRVEPLVEVDLDEIQARTVVAENLPDDHSIQNLEKLFATAGTVKMVRVCEPGSANGVNTAAVKNPKVDRIVSNKLHALVEYETVEQAEKAVADLTDQRNWRSGLHVRLLLRRMYPTKQHNNHAGKGRKSVSDQQEAFADEDSGEKPSESEPLDPTAEETGGDLEKEKRSVVVGRGRGRGRGNRGRQGMNNGNGGMLGSSPQVSFSPLPSELMVAKPPPGPRMPDGTRGFTCGRGKSNSIVSS